MSVEIETMIHQREYLQSLRDLMQELRISPKLNKTESVLLMDIIRDVSNGNRVSLNELKKRIPEAKLPKKNLDAFLLRECELDDKGNIVGVYGLSQNRGRHRIFINGKMLYTWCALDSLYMAQLFNQTVRVESVCPQTNDQILLTLSPQKVEKYKPADAIISVVHPATNQCEVTTVDAVNECFCQYSNFFSSIAAAKNWFHEKNVEIKLLSINSGFLLGGLLVDPILPYNVPLSK